MNNNRYHSGKIFLFLIPILAIVIFLSFDFFFRIYQDIKINSDSKKILKTCLSDKELSSLDDYKKCVKKAYKEKKYSTNDLYLILEDDKYILYNQKYYMNLIGTLTNGKLHNKFDLISATLEGYIEDDKIIINKITEDTTEDVSY